jgi:hypothetical protein
MGNTCSSSKLVYISEDELKRHVIFALKASLQGTASSSYGPATHEYIRRYYTKTENRPEYNTLKEILEKPFNPATVLTLEQRLNLTALVLLITAQRAGLNLQTEEPPVLQ